LIRFLFFIVLLSGALLAFMGTAALALHLLGRALGAVKDQFRGGRALAGEARLLRDPVYGTIILPLSGRVIPPREGPALATASAGERTPKRLLNETPEKAPAQSPKEDRPAFADAAARCRDLALVTTDRAGRITSCNLGGEEVLGIDWRRDAGTHITKFLTGADAAFIRGLTDPAKDKEFKTLKCPLPECSPVEERGDLGSSSPSLRDCPARHLLVTATVLRDEEGRLEGFLFTAYKGERKPEAVHSA